MAPGKPCAACGGTGTVAFGTDDVPCTPCDGTGIVEPKPTPKPVAVGRVEHR